jgi:hypothetical protein
MSRTWRDDEGNEYYFVHQLDGTLKVAKVGPDTVRIPEAKPPVKERQEMSEQDDVKAALATAIAECVKRQNLAVAKLTEDQMAAALMQAIQCGDFVRHVRVTDNGQNVVYVPFATEAQLLAQVKELKETVRRLNIELNEKI